MEVVRVGLLGASRIAPKALLTPARDLPEVEVLGVATRDISRTRAFAREHGIPKTYDSYDDLLADPDIDAVYNPLPNSLHGRWTIAALEAAKHVLCEKPFTANADEAQAVEAAVTRLGTDRVVMEGMHYRHHPLAVRMVEVVDSGTLGVLRHVDARMMALVHGRDNIRYQQNLAGGATMDVGCYALHQIRTLARREPTVVSARAKLATPGIDRWMRADLEFDGDATGQMTCAVWSGALPLTDVRIRGAVGTMRVLFPNQPQFVGRIVVKGHDGHIRRERIPAGDTSFWHQLRAFSGAILRGEHLVTPIADAIANMRAIDAVYEAAGLAQRQPAH